MNAVQTMNGNYSLMAAGFNDSYIDQFLAFIDRGAKTTQTYLTNLKQFAAWMKYQGVVQPVRDDVISFRDYLAAEHDAIKLDACSASG